MKGTILFTQKALDIIYFYMLCLTDKFSISYLTGCGKTMLAKAVAHHTTASFIRVVGSEFVQKYLGEGPRMVRDVFRLAKENSPSIIFIDEIDAIATKRFDAQTGADREVQRILLELLNQMDGFDQTTNVKVIMATNRQDTLDPALLRPGRLGKIIVVDANNFYILNTSYSRLCSTIIKFITPFR